MKNDMLFLFIRVIFFCVEFICNCKIYCKGFLNVLYEFKCNYKIYCKGFFKKKKMFF